MPSSFPLPNIVLDSDCTAKAMGQFGDEDALVCSEKKSLNLLGFSEDSKCPLNVALYNSSSF